MQFGLSILEQFGKKKSEEENLNMDLNLNVAIREVRSDIKRTYEFFNLADDDSLIEAYIHQINALNSRYDYLIKQAKKDKMLNSKT